MAKENCNGYAEKMLLLATGKEEQDIVKEDRHKELFTYYDLAEAFIAGEDEGREIMFSKITSEFELTLKK